MNLKTLRRNLNRLPMAMFRIEKAMNTATKVNSPLSDMPKGSMSGSRMDDNIILLETAKQTYRKLKEEVKRQQDELRPLIDKLDEPLARTAMKMRYLKGYSVR